MHATQEAVHVELVGDKLAGLIQAALVVVLVTPAIADLHAHIRAGPGEGKVDGSRRLHRHRREIRSENRRGEENCRSSREEEIAHGMPFKSTASR
jgi:hypothetical protein